MKEVIRISLIGAGFVVLGLMALWFLMDILVRVTANRSKIEHAEKNDASAVKNQEAHLKQKAAAAATAVSIALLKSSFLLSEKQGNQSLSAWQSTNRHSQLHNQPGQGRMKRNSQ